ncbi:helical backbone metal receptor [Fodinicola feengrottensis]|uniref:Helical backbone metal receptor n=1 Tax=Fodinicola feengrottensis TaxID=435914 RepID=A0ABN2G5F0_9ACTN
MKDDLGEEVTLAGRPRRIVSLVPSLTQSVAVTGRDLLVGATDFCTHPTDLAVARVGGSKYPRVADVLACEPDLVLADMDENRKDDVLMLRNAGVPVWVVNPRTVPQALVSLGRMLRMCGLGKPAWLTDAETVWASLPEKTETVRVAIPVWRRPWVLLGGATFSSDLLARLGYVNVFSGERFPRPKLAEIQTSGAELVILPNEPYEFTAEDGPEAFPDTDCALVDGRFLTWYGPTLATAPQVLGAQLNRRMT